MKDAKDTKLTLVYTLANADGVTKKNTETYEVENKELIIKTYNALKDRALLSSPNKGKNSF